LLRLFFTCLHSFSSFSVGFSFVPFSADSVGDGVDVAERGLGSRVVDGVCSFSGKFGSADSFRYVVMGEIEVGSATERAVLWQESGYQ